MGCGCQDREKDTEIIRTIAEKTLKDSAVLPYNLVDIMWSGSLLDVQFYTINLENVLYITKINEREYMATIKQDINDT